MENVLPFSTLYSRPGAFRHLPSSGALTCNCCMLYIYIYIIWYHLIYIIWYHLNPQRPELKKHQ